MTVRLKLLIELLHAPGHGALATQSASMPGYPFSSAVAFATDERHRPMFLISRLAEHTRNLLADAHASLAVAKDLGAGEIARASIIGDAVLAEISPALMARYLRYRPEAERFLELGDFSIYRIEPRRVRVVGGFGLAGWVQGQALLDAPHLSLEAETAVLDAVYRALPADVALLGIDAYGADYLRAGVQQRSVFDGAPLGIDALRTELLRTFTGP